MTRNILLILMSVIFTNARGQSDLNQDSIQNIISLNLNKIESYKTTLDKNIIETYLIGNWKFINIQTFEGKVLDSIKIEFFDRIGELHTFKPEKAIRSDIKFSENKRYEVFDKPQNESSTGKWTYENNNRRILLTYDKPYLPDFLKEVNPNFPGIKDRDILIFKLSANELYTMELYPINEFEKWFYLCYYKK